MPPRAFMRMHVAPPGAESWREESKFPPPERFEHPIVETLDFTVGLSYRGWLKSEFGYELLEVFLDLTKKK